MLLNWIRKRLGYHVCEEFTQWEQNVHRYSRPAMIGEPGYTTFEKVKVTVEFQERRCTLCGRVFRENISAIDL